MLCINHEYKESGSVIRCIDLNTDIQNHPLGQLTYYDITLLRMHVTFETLAAFTSSTSA